MMVLLYASSTLHRTRLKKPPRRLPMQSIVNMQRPRRLMDTKKKRMVRHMLTIMPPMLMGNQRNTRSTVTVSIMELMRRETMETMVSMANMGSTVMDMGTKALTRATDTMRPTRRR